MESPTSAGSSPAATQNQPTDITPRLAADEYSAKRNFFTLASYQIVMRIGWIFKTESIIMPAIMDILCGPGTMLAAWMRSWLPQLNRFGQSIPQLIFANRIRNARQKKIAVAFCSGLMSLAFLLFACCWFLNSGAPSAWMRTLFLLIYALFFISVGINNLAFNTLQGKLVRYNYRGRLFMLANSVGGLSAIVAAWWLLAGWLEDSIWGIATMFTFAGVCFLIGSLLSLSCRELASQNQTDEQKDNASAARSYGFEFLITPFRLFRQNPQFRRLAIVAACFGTSMVLFPHYQAYYREIMEGTSNEFDLSDMVAWVIIQNLGTVLISWFAGPLADRLGNRLVLQIILLLLGSAPIVAWLLSGSEMACEKYYFIVFLLVGVTPVTIRVLNNLALELAPLEQHPKFLSSLSLCIALPVILISQLIGVAIPFIGYPVLFWGVAITVFAGWILTFSVSEPRTWLTNKSDPSDNSRQSLLNLQSGRGIVSNNE